MTYDGGGGRPGGNWDGHLPSNPMERKILEAVEGIEDEDGRTNGFLQTDDPEMTVFRQRRVNTGPKGVMEDAKRHYAMQHLKAQAERARLQEQLRRQANPTVKPVDGDGDSDSFEDSDEEDEEFKRYKLERLREMQQKAAASARLPTFGAVEAVDALDMPAAIDNAGSSQTFVVVHLQEEYLAACVRLGFKLEALAKKYDQVKFLKVTASEAMPKLDPANLPMVIVYQAGNYMTSAERVGRDEGESLSTTQVEEALMRLGVRFTASSVMREADAAALQRLRELDLDAGGGGGGGGGSSGARGGDDEEEEEEEEEEGAGSRRKGTRLVADVS